MVCKRISWTLAYLGNIFISSNFKLLVSPIFYLFTFCLRRHVIFLYFQLPVSPRLYFLTFRTSGVSMVFVNTLQLPVKLYFVCVSGIMFLFVYILHCLVCITFIFQLSVSSVCRILLYIRLPVFQCFISKSILRCILCF